MKKKPVNPFVKHIKVVFRVDAEEMRYLLEKAHGSAGGVVSKWVRKVLFKNKAER